MQAVLIMGLFSAFYIFFAAATTVLSQSAIQTKLSRMEQTREIFRDFEYAVNEIYLTEFPDFINMAAADINSMMFASEYMSWQPDLLQNDPWGQPYQVIGQYSNLESIYADLDGNSVQAPVRSFALISAGPDGVMEDYSADDDDYFEVRSLSAIGDDIVHTFTTRTAMLREWNAMRDSLEKIEVAIRDDYVKQFKRFSQTPEYTNFMAEVINDQLNSNALQLDDVTTSWLDLGNPNYAGYASLNGMVAVRDDPNSFYPRISTDFVSSLGIESVLRQAPGLMGLFGQDKSDLRVQGQDFMDFSDMFTNIQHVDAIIDSSVRANLALPTPNVNNAIGNTWNVNYTLVVDGGNGL